MRRGERKLGFWAFDFGEGGRREGGGTVRREKRPWPPS